MDCKIGVESRYLEEIRNLSHTDGYCADLPVGLIEDGQNVRQELELDDEFIESIRVNGVLQPILVTITPLNTVLCVAGHRRLAAAKFLGFQTIKCIGKPLRGRARVIAALSENVNRSALHPLDLAESLQELELQGTTRREMEAFFGRDRKTIARFLKMAAWTAEAKEIVRAHPTSFNSRTLLALASKRMTTREVEATVKAIAYGSYQTKTPRRTATQLREELNRHLEQKDLSADTKHAVFDAFKALGLIPQDHA